MMVLPILILRTCSGSLMRLGATDSGRLRGQIDAAFGNFAVQSLRDMSELRIDTSRFHCRWLKLKKRMRSALTRNAYV